MAYLWLNLIAIIFIALTLWWFLLGKREVKVYSAMNNVAIILVKDGVYEPAQLRVAARHIIILRFLREDPTPCAEVVVFPQMNRSYFLPMNEVLEILLDPQPAGVIDFSCQMGMYRGKLIVE